MAFFNRLTYKCHLLQAATDARRFTELVHQLFANLMTVMAADCLYREKSFHYS